MNIYLVVDLPTHPPRQTLLLSINQAKTVGPVAYCVVIDQMLPSMVTLLQILNLMLGAHLPTNADETV